MKFKIDKKSFSLLIFVVFLSCFFSRMLSISYGTFLLTEDQLVEKNIYATQKISIEGQFFEKGDLIMAAGEGHATKEIISMLEEEGRLRTADWSFKLLSDTLYFLLLLALVWIAVEKVGYPISNFSHNLNFLAFLASSLIFSASLISIVKPDLNPTFQLAIPISTCLLTLIILYPFRFALIYSLLMLYLLIPILPHLEISNLVGIFSALAAIVGIKDRSKIKLFESVGFLVLFLWLLDSLVHFSKYGTNTSITDVILMQSLPGSVIVGVFVFSLVTLFLKIAKKSFLLSTPEALVELSAPDHFLLSQLAEKAPGTMAHVHAVQEIAEAGCSAISSMSQSSSSPVNPWLVRAGALFHDIGKIERPHFFSENQKDGDNPHEDLSPQMSARLLISHVKSGVELAKANKLPDRVISIIKSHHGQTLAGHFYTLAKEQAEAVGATPPNDKDFRYPGPKPKAIEEVIVSLADAVEAISRSLRDLPSEDLVKILKEEIKARESEGHFSESEITTAQFSVLKKAVLDEAVLRHHRRIGYIKES
ncbi:hypothetical protein CL659_05615 [bacterium]|nr:hypothetical protein [bacterium]|tara:strand:- start:14247 stop:15851 length:1605 start_codon:yes stop_codon:yes gene_type:complete